MAGLGESCSHVGALLFYIEATIKIRDAKTVTEEKAYWMLPSSCKEIPYAEITEIDFTSPNTLKKKFNQNIENNQNKKIKCDEMKKKSVPNFPSDEKLKHFYQSLNLCKSKPAILSIVPPYDEKYKPALLSDNFPKILTELYDPSKIEMNYLDLCKLGENVELKITCQQQLNVEMETRKQSESNKWFQFRSGRITASKVHSVVHTKEDMPSQSLIKSICYPGSYKFESTATSWGCSHEEKALNIYKNIMKEHHENFEVNRCGFFISIDYPFIGASPDGLISCSCCGEGCVEIKCPFCHKDQFIFEAVEQNKTFCLKKENNNIKLSEKHQYYYQIQTQLHVSNRLFCDLFVWTDKDYHIERIWPNKSMWSIIIEKCRLIFNVAILPELIGKFFSRETNYCINNNPNNEKVCYCGGEESGELFQCSNKACKYKLFHLGCVKLKNKPKRKWLCPDCRKTNMSTSKVTETINTISDISENWDMPIPIIIEP